MQGEFRFDEMQVVRGQVPNDGREPRLIFLFEEVKSRNHSHRGKSRERTVDLLAFVPNDLRFWEREPEFVGFRFRNCRRQVPLT